MSNYIPSFYVAHILIVIVVLFFVLDATKNVTPNCNFSTIQMNTTLATACVFYFYNRHFLQRLPSGDRSCCNKNLVSVCTLKLNTGGVSRGFTNIKSNRNPTGKCFPLHTVKMNIFHADIRRGRSVYHKVGEWVTQREYQVTRGKTLDHIVPQFQLINCQLYIEKIWFRIMLMPRLLTLHHKDIDSHGTD